MRENDCTYYLEKINYFKGGLYERNNKGTYLFSDQNRVTHTKKTRKCHIPIAQRLEQSACDKGVMGLGPIRDVHFFSFTRFPLFQEQLSKV